jgi:hypothetical protein
MAARSDRHLLEAGWVSEWRERFRAALDSSLVDEFVPFEPAHPSFRDEYILHCPCCHKKVQVLEQQSLLELQRKRWLAVCASLPANSENAKSSAEINQSWMQYLRELDQGFPWIGRFHGPPDWACDECVSSAVAESADFEESYIFHNTGYWGYSHQNFYFDQKLNCNLCNEEFTYSKGEQRWLDESFVLSTNSRMTHCKACRLEKRERNRIAPLIHLTKTDPDPFPFLEIVTDLMLRFNDPRALLYLRRAKNRAPTTEKRREYEVKIAALEGQT